jgi:hypothetical protein
MFLAHDYVDLGGPEAVVLAEPAVLECVTNAGVSQRCCIKDGRRPPGVGLQELASNRPVLLRSKGVVVSDCGKGADKRRQVRIEKMSESKPFEDASLSWSSAVKTKVVQ